MQSAIKAPHTVLILSSHDKKYRQGNVAHVGINCRFSFFCFIFIFRSFSLGAIAKTEQPPLSAGIAGSSSSIELFDSVSSSATALQCSDEYRAGKLRVRITTSALSYIGRLIVQCFYSGGVYVRKYSQYIRRFKYSFFPFFSPTIFHQLH